MSSTIKIKAPAMPEPTRQEEQAPFEAWADNYSPSGDCESLHRQWKESSWRESWLQERDAYYRERDAQWQESVEQLVKAFSLHLQDAISVCNSVSTCLARKVTRDGCVMYLQTEEWCKWLEDELQPKFRAALSAITEE